LLRVKIYAKETKSFLGAKIILVTNINFVDYYCQELWEFFLIIFYLIEELSNSMITMVPY